MRIFKTKAFARFARGEKIADKALCNAVGTAERELIDADLGGGIIKQRVPRPGKGKSGGFRTLIAYRAGDLAVFIYGFAKRDRGNVEDDELEDLQTLAAQWLRDAAKIKMDVEAGILIEVKCDDKDDDDDKKGQQALKAAGGAERAGKRHARKRHPR